MSQAPTSTTGNPPEKTNKGIVKLVSVESLVVIVYCIEVSRYLTPDDKLTLAPR